MKSIKTKIVGNFMLVIVISVTLLELILINAIQRYYYGGIEDVLTNQIKISADFYSRYFSNSSLQDNIMTNIDVITEQTSAQVEIVDVNGNVLLDSIGVKASSPLLTEDIRKALNGEKGKWIGPVPYDADKVMSISYPLKSNDNVVGAIRFSSSLKSTDMIIKRIIAIFLGVGLIAVLITGTISLFLSKSIIGSISDITKVAEELASGNFNIRSRKWHDDEIGKLSDTLNYMADEVVKREQLKNEFISSVSHELRTPLTSIKGWAITLNSTELDDKEIIRDGLDIIEKESERLTGMVEELLDFSKLISGKTNVVKSNGSLCEIVDHVQKQVLPRAQRENIQFHVEMQDSFPSLPFDKNRILQVLLNIIDNSFKFTKPGGVITVAASYDAEHAMIKITDSGCGIAPEDLPRVKEKFYKGKSSKSQNGIGLSICDEIISQHKGTFQIRSILNEGTAVMIKLPLHPEE